MSNEKNILMKSWYKKWWVIALFIFIGLGILGSLGKEAPKTTQVEKNAGSETTQNDQGNAKSYQQVFAFNGNGTKKSEPFTVSGSRFKIKYDCAGDLCQAFLYKIDSKLPTLIMNNTGSVKDETIVYGSGEYYIDANTIGKYTMIVEDYK